MTALSEVERVDHDLRACYRLREEKRDQLIDALVALLSIEHRVDVLLDRRQAASCES